MDIVSVYIINEITRDPEGGDAPDGWFEERGSAQAECDRLNDERRRRGLDDNYQVAEAKAESYEASRARAESVKAAALAATRLTFVAGCRELFGANPGFQSFGWKQYVRYSARDDMSDFGVYAHEPDVNGVAGGEVDDGREYDPASGGWVQRREPSPESRLQPSVAAFLESFEEADLGALFGEDVAVNLSEEQYVHIVACQLHYRRKVYVAADNDEAGKDFARQAADKLSGASAPAVIFPPPGRKDFGDCSVEEIRALGL